MQGLQDYECKRLTGAAPFKVKRGRGNDAATEFIHGMKHYLPKFVTIAATLLLAGGLFAQENGEPYGPQPTVEPTVESYGPQPTGGPKSKLQYEQNLKLYADNPDVLVLPGLVANRKELTVDVLVEATGLGGEAVAEFLLIDQNSSHGYEGLLWSFAKPSDVHAGLLFIGLSPGSPYNPKALRFFADGAAVDLFIKEPDGDMEYRIEKLILDRKTGKSLPQDGFVFTGSIMLPLEEGQPADTPRYAADVYDPRSVASVYNEPTAVLDVPRMVQKGEAYGTQVVNPETAFDGGTLLRVVMRPREDEKLQQRHELVLDVAAATNSAAEALMRLGRAGGKVFYEGDGADGVLKALTGDLKTLPEGQAAYMQLDLDASAPLVDVRKVAASLVVLESMGVLKVKPPLDGQLYYRAFVPDRRWIDPAGRPAQPWELHLTRRDGMLAGELVINQAVWRKEDSTPSFTRTVVPTPTPASVRAQLDADTKARADAGDAPAPGALLTYAEKGMTVGDVMSFLRPLMDTHGAVYVFSEQ